MFENLKKLVIAENQKYLDHDTAWIKAGHDSDPDAGLRYHSTATRWQQYQKGEITREQAISYAVKRAAKKADKRLNEKLDKLERIATAPETTNGAIYVEWRRSYAWGYNPAAELCANTGRSYGYASGCGYDKLSAACAEALNNNDGVLKAIYLLKDTALQENPETTSHQALGYGSGYTALPYFEGGVGQSTLNKILEKAGYTVNWHSSKHYDTVIFSKNN